MSSFTLRSTFVKKLKRLLEQGFIPVDKVVVSEPKPSTFGWAVCVTVDFRDEVLDSVSFSSNLRIQHHSKSGFVYEEDDLIGLLNSLAFSYEMKRRSAYGE